MAAGGGGGGGGGRPGEGGEGGGCGGNKGGGGGEAAPHRGTPPGSAREPEGRRCDDNPSCSRYKTRSGKHLVSRWRIVCPPAGYEGPG